MKINSYPGPLLAPDDGGGEGAPNNSLGDILSKFGEPGQGDSDPTPGQQQDPPPQDPPPTDPQAGDPPSADPNLDPKNAAFANMRVANNQLKQSNDQLTALVSKVAKAMGIDGNDINDLMTKLDDDALTKLAQKDNVPVDLYKRLNTLEQTNTQFQQIQLQAEANKGFQSLQQEFGLTQQELIEYGTQLDQAGMNPFKQAMDIRADYVSRNLDKIIEKKVQASLARDSKGDNHSSTPGNKSGGDGGAPATVTTVQGLRSVLKGIDM